MLVARPPRGRQVLAAINASGGVCVSVGETALGAALRRLGHAGIFAEPTAALAIAALGPLVASGVLRPGETVVCAITGHGLKAPGAVAALLGGATP